MLIYLSETVWEVNKILLGCKYKTEYLKIDNDPEYANAYLVDKNESRTIYAIISSVARWRKAKPRWLLPKNAKSCVQITMQCKEKNLLKLFKQKFEVVAIKSKLIEKGENYEIF